MGDNIAIFGCGGVGLSAIMAAKLVGCNHIIAIDINSSRLSLAKELGATHIINPNESDNLVDEIISYNNNMGVDYSLDTSGNPNALKAGFDVIRPLGMAALVAGSAPGTEISIDMQELLVHGKHFIKVMLLHLFLYLN